MDWLNAALAFAITMLMLAMVVSTIVETLHRLIGLREKGLRQMLGHLFDQVLAAYPSVPADTRAAFVAAMTENRAPTPALVRESVPARPPNATWLEVKRWLQTLFGARGLAELGLHPFMERLGSTDVGAALVQDLAAAGLSTIDVALHDVAQKFEAFGQEASVYFERRARLTSVVVSLILGVCLYVHPRDLLRTYLTDPKVRNDVIEQSQAAQEAYRSHLKQEALKKEDDKQQGTNAKPGEKTQGGDANADDAKAMQAEVAAVKGQIDTLQAMSVPIGWVGDKWPVDAMWMPKDGWVPPAAWWVTLLWLLAGGLLVGLGGPFWYDAVTSITNIREILGPAKTAAKTSDAADAKTPVEAAIDAFRVSVAARELTNVGVGWQPEDDVAVG